jgi:hypothetical protein
MTEHNEEEEDGIRPPRPPASDYEIVPPPAGSRSTDNGDDKLKSPPHSSRSPFDEMTPTTTCSAATLVPPLLLRPAGPLRMTSTSTAETPTAAPQEVTPPFKKNRPAGKAEGGSRKNISPDVHRRKRLEEVSGDTEDYDLTNPDEEEDVVSPLMILPGAFSFGAISTRLDMPSTLQTTSSSGQFIKDTAVADPSTTQLEPQIVVFLAADDEDNQQVEARIAQKAPDEVLRRQMEEGEVIAANEVNENSSTSSVLKKQTLLVLLMGIISMLSIIACIGRVESRGVISSSAETGDRLLEELRSLGAISEDEVHLLLFSDPKSPQSQALTWMRKDPIVMSPRRSMKDLLQRYVLAVLFYATNGSRWVWSESYLSSKDVCSWNKEGIPFTSDYVYGVHCQSDGESVDGLVLSENSLIGQLPWELVLLTDLKTIDLGWNTLIGSIPRTKLGQLVSLEYLDISSNDLTGTIPTELGQLVSLEYLDISSNDLTGTIPTELGRMLSWKHLWIDSNLLTGTIPTELGQLLSLEWLVIRGNQLTGTIPTELCQLLSLKSLDIGGNDLSGAIPTELGQLLSLKWLVIGNNDLTGTIPTELGQLDSLEFLWIYQNQLSGRIPTELGQLLSLVNLDIRFNGVTGTIPTELGQPISLGYLDISSNQLSGTIPNELAGIGAYLEQFDASNNALTGSVDQSFCVENLTLYSLVVDCDQVECSCCYYCE